jgi:pimeloyl-ACP methyl ester carboxylesterase
LNGGLFPETHRALLTQKLLLSPVGFLINGLSGKSHFDRSFNKVFGDNTKPSAQELDEFWHLIKLKGGKHIFHNLMTYIRDRRLHRERWILALQEAKIPIGLINGSADPVSGSHMVARYQELNCRLDYLAELPAVGHYPQVESADEVSNHYLGFLKQQVN